MHVSHTMRLTDVFQTHILRMVNTYGARSMRLKCVLYRTFNACFTYGERTLYF